MAAAVQHQVRLWGALRPFADGAETVTVSAGTIRELFAILRERYPGMIPLMDQGVAVSINGDIYRDSWNKSLPDAAEIYLLPRIEGG